MLIRQIRIAGSQRYPDHPGSVIREHLADIHAVDMIGSKHRDCFGIHALQQLQVLINRVSGSLEPLLAVVGPLRTCSDVRMRRSPILREMPQERAVVELGENVNGLDAGVDEVA